MTGSPSAAAPGPAGGSHYLRMVVTWSVVRLVNHFARMMFPVLLPFVRDAYAISNTQLGMMVTLNLVCDGLGQVTGGYLSDRCGRKAVALAGGFGFAGGLFLCFLSGSFASLAVFWAVTGFFSGIQFGPGLSMMTGPSTAGRKGFTLGLMFFISSLGTLAGPLLVSALDHLDFHFFLALNAALALAAVLPFLLLYRDDEPGGVRGGAAVFLRRDLRSAFARLALFQGVTMLVFFSVSNFIPILLVDGMGLSKGIAPVYYAFLLVGSSIGSPLSGYLTDRVGRRRVIFASTLLRGSFFGLLAVAPLLLVAPVLLVLGLARTGVFPGLLSITSEVEPKFRGTMLGFVGATAKVGGAFGPLLFGLLTDVGDISTAVLLVAAASFVPLALVPLLPVPRPTAAARETAGVPRAG